MKQGTSLKTETAIIRRKKIVTLDELAMSLHCSKRTVQRRLTQLKIIRSYNRNGQYYTLEEVPRFDTNGLWQCRGTYFSRFGNLTLNVNQHSILSQAGISILKLRIS